MNEIDFAKKITEFQKIRNLENKTVASGLSMIFTKASNLSGIKEPISQINKTDIAEMISLKYKFLSLEEIEFAFKHDRYSGDAIPHFQLFNAEYVSKVLKKYTDFITKVRQDNNIVGAVKELPKHIISEADRLKLIDKHLTEMTLQFLKTGEIEANYMYLYYELFKQGKLPRHDKKYTDWIKKRVHKQLYKSKGISISNLENNKRKALIKFHLGNGKSEAEVHNVLKQYNLLLIPKENYQIKKTLKAIQTGKIDISYHCRNLILKDYLNNKIKTNE
ncbi:hypothetical protein SAMN04488006_0451 [Lutibacter maritimus]|uniref:Uncharacterized protein n=1 Tax=Lutibacter maritimus TaxID=593133 RepID=A0A1I6NRK9_9FLAO|nr:hypothetical protein SAMN04488006_0451 [Lutibacter maritimus]